SKPGRDRPRSELRRSSGALVYCRKEEAGDVLGCELRACDGPQVLETEGDEVVVEIAEAWRERDRLDPGSFSAAGQRCHGSVAGGVGVAGDVEATQRVRELDGGQMRCRQRGQHRRAWKRHT